MKKEQELSLVMKWNNFMQAIRGLVILIVCLLVAVYVTVDYLMPNVICKMIPRTSSDSHMGAYNSHVLSDICSGIGR